MVERILSEAELIKTASLSQSNIFYQFHLKATHEFAFQWNSKQMELSIDTVTILKIAFPSELLNNTHLSVLKYSVCSGTPLLVVSLLEKAVHIFHKSVMDLKRNRHSLGQICTSNICRCRRRSSIKNPHIEDLKEDILYHLGLTTSNDDLQIMFGDVKFVCVGGTPERMYEFAEYMRKVLGLSCSDDEEIENVSKSTRYAMFKFGPVLCVSHGIGSPSISVVLHEIMKLMHHAGAEDPVFLRIGTCGGLGIPPGSLVITTASVDGLLRPYQELVVLGQRVQRPSTLDEEFCKELKLVAEKYLQDCTVVTGKTMCADDFYEGQGRLDGAFCEYSNEDKLSYLKKLKEEGVVNIEMESLTFASMCLNAGVKGGVICVTLLDRLKEDQVTATGEMLKKWQRRVLHLAAMYIKEKLNGHI